MGKYSKRKLEQEEEPVVHSSSIAVIILSVIVGLIFLSIGLSIYNYTQSFGKISSAQVTQTSLKKKYSNLKPQITEKSASKLDLEGQEKELTKIYKTLVSYAYGDMKKPDDFAKNKQEFEDWFSPVGAETIKKDVVLKSGNKQTLLAKKNLKTYVGFGSPSNVTTIVKVTIYTTYDISDGVGNYSQGQTLITLDYDLSRKLPLNTKVRSMAVK